MNRPSMNHLIHPMTQETGARLPAGSSYAPKHRTRRLALKLALLLMFSLTTTTTALADEVLIGIGDGPVSDEELGISDQDLAAATDGSMIPEYKISEIHETSANVVSEQYTVAQNSTAAETIQEAAVSTEGKETLLEIVDSVDDFAVFKKNTQSATGAASTPQKSTVSAAANILTNVGTSGVSTAAGNIIQAAGDAISGTRSSSGTSSGAAVTNAGTSILSRGNVIEAGTSIVKSISSSLPVIATTASRQALIQYAKQFLGNPYVYGGTSLTDGADCSGFVQQIFKHFGITTGRSSRDQYANAQSISFEQLQPGDLVFYASGDYINHVAIYAGDGVIIHAANARTGICTGRYDYRTPVGYGRFIQN